MARSDKGSASGEGHNTALTDEERAALQLWFSTKILEAQKARAKTKAADDEAREVINGLFSQARGELRITRKEFEELLELQAMSEAEFRHHEAKRTGRMRDQGLPVGEQMDLPLGDTADEKAAAYADGYRAGMRGDDGIPPSKLSPVLHQDWMAGWTDGQAKLAEGLKKADAIIAAREAEKSAPPAPEGEAEGEVVGDQPQEGDDEEVEEAVDRAARKLRRSKFMDTSAKVVGDAPVEEVV